MLENFEKVEINEIKEKYEYNDEKNIKILDSNIDKIELKDYKVKNSEYLEDLKKFNDLSDKDIEKIKESTNWSDRAISNCLINKDGVVKYKCDNERYLNHEYKDTGIEYKKRIIDLNGLKVETVVPDFESKFDVKLDKELYESSNAKQIDFCNNKLRDLVDSNEKLKSKFSKEELEYIYSKETPKGYTWHHDVEPGNMQLVDYSIHRRSDGVPHTGGQVIWGGGKDNR